MNFVQKLGMSLMVATGLGHAAQAQDAPAQENYIQGLNYVYNMPPAEPDKNIVFVMGRTDIQLRGPVAELRVAGNNTVYVDGTNPAFMKNMVKEITESAKLAKSGHAKDSRYELVGAQINELNELAKDFKAKHRMAPNASFVFTVGAMELTTSTNREAVAAGGKLKVPMTLLNNQ